MSGSLFFDDWETKYEHENDETRMRKEDRVCWVVHDDMHGRYCTRTRRIKIISQRRSD